MNSGLVDEYGRPLRNSNNFQRTADAFREEAKKARRAASSIPGTIARGLPGLAPVAAVGAGIGLAAATANIGFNAARDYMGRRSVEEGPKSYTEGSVSQNAEQANRQAQALLQRYADEADRAASTKEELDKLGVNNTNLSELQNQEALENMYIGIEDKRNKMLLANEAAMQPYYSASRLRERLPEMSRNSYNFINNLVASRGSMR